MGGGGGGGGAAATAPPGGAGIETEESFFDINLSISIVLGLCTLKWWSACNNIVKARNVS